MSGDNHLPAWLSEDPRDPIDLASIPYLERQTIVVVSDAEAAEARAALRGAALAPSSEKQLQVADRLRLDPLFALALASAVEVGWISRSRVDLVVKGLPYLPIVARRARDFQKTFRAWRRARTATLLISTTEQSQLRWPKGDPVRDQVYAGSPADAKTYYPLASFHDDVFFERASELRRLLSRLGARRVMAKHVVIGGSSGRGRLIGRAEQVGVPIVAKARKRVSRELEEMFDREMSSGSPKSHEEVTRDLHWIAKEPDWQELIDERFADRLRKDKLVFRADTDYGLGAGVQAAVSGLPADVKVGGKFKRYERRQIELEVEFDPLPG
jgi:hypothetical protein